MVQVLTEAQINIFEFPLASVALLGTAVIGWLTRIAVPLGVLVAILIAMTLGYGLLIGRIVSFVSARRQPTR
jgi:hypothetical protein